MTMKRTSFFILLFGATLALPAVLNADTAPVASSSPSIQTSLPDFMVSSLSIQNKKGANEGWYVYVTVENKGESITRSSFLSLTLTGLESIGLPKGYVMYLTHDKSPDGAYPYPTGYKKDLIGPKVTNQNLKELTVTAMIDPGSYFAESDETNNALTKTLTLPSTPKKPTQPQTATEESEDDENEAALIVASGTDLQKLLDHVASEKDVDAQKNAMKKYTEPLVKKMKLSENQKYAINNFIVYGTQSAAKLTTGKRANLIKTFKKKTKKLPKKEADWQKILDTAYKK